MYTSASFNVFLKVIKNPFFVMGWFVLMGLSYFFLDQKITIFMHISLNQHLYQISEHFTVLGLGTYYLIAFSAFFLLGKYIVKNYDFAYKSLYLLACVIVSGIACDILKFLFGRARPELLFNKHLYGFYFLKTHYAMISFPSGHATTITAVMLGLCFIKPKYWYAFMLIALVVALSRVFITAHYLSDVMGGMFLGTFSAIWVREFFKYSQLIDEFYTGSC